MNVTFVKRSIFRFLFMWYLTPTVSKTTKNEEYTATQEYIL